MADAQTTIEKPPVIRRGQSKPYRKATLEQSDERIEQAKFLLCSGVSRFQIHRHFREKHQVVWQTAERYMRHARLEMLAEAGKDKAEVRADAVGFYQSVIQSTKSTFKEKLQARQRLDEIYGIDAPRHTHVSTPDGGKVVIEHKVKKGFDHDGYREICESFFGVPDQNGDGQSVHPAGADAAPSLVSGTGRN